MKRNELRTISRLLCAALFGIAAVGCASAPVVPEKIVWESIEKDESGRLTMKLSKDSKIALTGEVLPDAATNQVQATELSWFTNWNEGWTEAKLACVGRLEIVRDGEAWNVNVIEPVMISSAESAKLRYKDAYYKGEEARNLLDRRISRIRSACAFLNQKFESKVFTIFESEEKELNKGSFVTEAGKALFPEVYGYPEGTEPEGKVASDGGKRFVKGEGLSWDRIYSENVLPEELREVRDSGTLYRDWEETRYLFYYIYTLER